MKSRNKFVVFLLTIVLVVSLFSVATFAMETEENSCTLSEGCTLEEGHEGECVMTKSDDDVTFDSVQAMINALPDEEDITIDNADDVEAQLDAIDEAKNTLYQAGGDVDSLDMTKYDAACEALAALNESDENTSSLLSSKPLLTGTEGTSLTSSGGSLSSGDYYLSADVTLTTDITIVAKNTVTIDLNGYTLTGTGSSCVITVNQNATFTLMDSSQEGTGIVTNGSKSSGGGVYVSKGSFTMSGGTISGNTASKNSGGGVYVSSGTFTMNGGSISENTANTNGGGVYVSSSTFTMNGGSISDNTANNGGGVYISGMSSTFTMNDGKISGNTAKSTYAGAIYISNGTFDMQGGTISKNIGSVGGGVYVSAATFDMSDGTITENSGSNGGGVNVSASGTFNMSGGQIIKNTASSLGGGVYVVRKNTFTVSGSPVISDNTGKETTQNVYLNENPIILGGYLTSDASIGVTMGVSLDPGESIQITTETGGYNYYLNALAYFHSDNPDYIVQTNTSGYLELYSALIPGSVSITGEAIYGQELTAKLSDDVPENVTYQWMRDGTAIAGATNSTYTLTGEDVGKSITVVVTHSSYTGSLTATAVTVSKATLTPALSGSTTKVYDGTLNITDTSDLSIELSGVISGDEDKVSVSAESMVFTTADVGTSKTISVTGLVLSGTYADYYTLSSTSFEAQGDFTITAATPTISISNIIYDKSYDGTAISDPTVTVTLTNNEEFTGTLTITYYSIAADGTETELTSAPSEVGDYKVVVTASNAGSNYESTSVSETFTISEAELSVTIKTSDNVSYNNITYDGTAHEVIVEADEGASVTITYTDSSGNIVAAPVNAGTYTAHVTVTKTGYTTFSEDVTISIAKAANDISYETMSITKTTNDEAFINELTQSVVNGTMTYESSDTSVATIDSNGKVTIVGAGTTIITATVLESENYTSASASYTLTVNAPSTNSKEENNSSNNTSTTTTSSTSNSQVSVTSSKVTTSDTPATTTSDTPAASIVQTDDSTNITLYVMLMLLVSLGFIAIKKRKYQ